MTTPLQFLHQDVRWGDSTLFDEGACPHPWQVEAARDLTRGLDAADYLKGVSDRKAQTVSKAVGSGHGSGATAFTALMVLWAISYQNNCCAVIITPTEQMCRMVVISEVEKWGKALVFGDIFEHTHGSNTWTIGSSNLIVTAQRDDPTLLAGIHREGLLFIALDAAAGISNKTWTLMARANKMHESRTLLLATGAPQRKGSTFNRALTLSAWHPAFASSTPENNVRADYAEGMARRWGTESDVYRARVLGLPPKEVR
jgi:phage terminase large subunit